MKNSDIIQYTLKHRQAFKVLEKKLLGHNTIRGLTHDLDKVLMYTFLDYEVVHRIHRRFSRHHITRARTYSDFVQMVIDWECARYTKPDKPLNARQTLDKFYKKHTEKILPIIDELGL